MEKTPKFLGVLIGAVLWSGGSKDEHLVNW